MLNKAKTLKGYKLGCIDGDIGKVKEFYFDDQHWTIRYLVADTGNWLTGRQVLISPHALVAVIVEEQLIAIDLTKKQIEDSPSLSSDKPVSRQFEENYYGYYGWPAYWEGPYMWGSYSYPFIMGDPKNGQNPPKMRKRGIPICEALTMRVAITSKQQTARLATSRILSSMTRRGRFVIW